MKPAPQSFAPPAATPPAAGAVHTPGPWLVSGRTVYALTHAGWRKGEEQFKNRFTMHVMPDRECPEGEAEAVAVLAGAAPDLLAALLALRLAREQDKYRSWEIGVPRFSEAEALADAAIARATGAAA